jgi:cell division protein FtsI/penicillin-binding protein 2
VRRPEPRRVVSEDTARAMTGMLEQVVTDGTGTAAGVPGYRVAGKTGTASKPREGAVGYEAGAYVASFAGFLPAESPRLSAIVILDEPTPYYGGLVSAPVFSQLAGYGVRLLGVPPTVAPTPGSPATQVPADAATPTSPGASTPSPTTWSPSTPTTLGRTPTSRP